MTAGKVGRSSIKKVAFLLVVLIWSSLVFCGEIHDAAANGNLAKVKRLIKGNPDLVFSKDKDGWTPFHWAKVNGRGDVVRFLIELGAQDTPLATNTAAAPASTTGQNDVTQLPPTNGQETTPTLAAATSNNYQAPVARASSQPDSNQIKSTTITALNEMAFVEAGSFTMGGSVGAYDIKDHDQVSVHISAFYVDKNLVSYAQWQKVCNWATNHGYGFVNPGKGAADNHPVQTVDWYDAVKWCNARSQQAGLVPVYYTDPEFKQVFTNNEQTPYANWTASGFRLPTEAEWEKAARGGLRGQRFPWGDTISKNQANYFGDTTHLNYDMGPDGYSGPADRKSTGNFSFSTPQGVFTSSVGSFPPNGYGLYDMAGNVFEWCWDYWDEKPYAGGTDPHGPTASADGHRVHRGGSWEHNASFAKCGTHSFGPPNWADQDIGFRCVRNDANKEAVAAPN